MVPSRDPRQLPGERRLQAARGRRRIGKSPVEPDRGCHVRLVRFRLTVDGCSERPRLRLDHRWLSVVLVPRRSVGPCRPGAPRLRSGRSASRSSGDVPWPACSRPPAVLRAASSASARALTRQEPPTGRMPGRPVVPRARPRARRRSAALQRPAPEWPWPARPGWPDPHQWSYRSSSRPTVPAPDLDRGAATRCCPAPARKRRAGEEERGERKARRNPSRSDPHLAPALASGFQQLAALPSHYGAQKRQRSREEEQVEEALPDSWCPLWHCLCSVHFERRGRPSARIFLDIRDRHGIETGIGLR